MELGTDIYTVQHLLAHKNVSTTQIYVAHASPKTREAANKIRLSSDEDNEKEQLSSLLILTYKLIMYQLNQH